MLSTHALRSRILVALFASLVVSPVFAAPRDADPYISGGRECKTDPYITGGGGYSVTSTLNEAA